MRKRPQLITKFLAENLNFSSTFIASLTENVALEVAQFDGFRID